MTTELTSMPSRAITAVRRLKPLHVVIGSLAVGLAIVILATQCQNIGSGGTLRALTQVELREEVVPVQLNSHQSCAELLAQIQEVAIARVDEHGIRDNQEHDPFFIDDTLVEEFDFEPRRSSNRSSSGSSGDALADASPAIDASPGDFMATTTTWLPSPGDDSAGLTLFSRSSGSALSHSTTNVQVAGVDEADIVKTNGRAIVGLSGQTLWLADVAAATSRIAAELEVSGGRFFEMLLSGDGDRALLIGESAVGVANADGSQRLASNQRAVVVTEIDISDPHNPQHGRHLRLEGRYVSSRLTPDGQVRVVVSSTPMDEFVFINPTRGQWSQNAAKLINQELVRQSTIEQWLPHYSLHNAAGQRLTSGVLLECPRVFLPDHFAGFSQVSVVSLNTNAPLAVGDATSVMAEGEVVYATAENLYVSHVVRDFTGFATQPSNDIQAETVVHKFALAANGQADYEGSGAVVGQPLNQFAFHEHNGHLFVATTVFSKRWESFVTSLEDVGNRLLINHKVGNLGQGESIYAVRYVGDKAYVVTFRQTDPLYVIDLSNPGRLKTKGELKITGYSAYLHPVGDDLLLGIGREGTNSGRLTGLKLSLFDVSDPSDPQEVDKLDFDGGSSAVEFDHRAFLWWEDSNLAVVPVKNDRSGLNGALGIRIRQGHDAAGEPFYAITLEQRITHDDLHLQGNRGACGWYRLPAEVSQDDSITKICPDSITRYSRDAATPESYQCDQADQFTAFELRQLATAFAGLAEASSRTGNSDGLGTARDLVRDLAGASHTNGYHFEVCTPDFNFQAPAILRSLVVGESLWTLSDELLQANDLNTLKRRAQLEIPRYT